MYGLKLSIPTTRYDENITLDLYVSHINDGLVPSLTTDQELAIEMTNYSDAEKLGELLDHVNCMLPNEFEVVPLEPY